MTARPDCASLIALAMACVSMAYATARMVGRAPTADCPHRSAHTIARPTGVATVLGDDAYATWAGVVGTVPRTSLRAAPALRRAPIAGCASAVAALVSKGTQARRASCLPVQTAARDTAHARAALAPAMRAGRARIARCRRAMAACMASAKALHARVKPAGRARSASFVVAIHCAWRREDGAPTARASARQAGCVWLRVVEPAGLASHGHEI